MKTDIYLMAFTSLSCLAAGLSAALAVGERLSFNWQTQKITAAGALLALIVGFAFKLASLGHPAMVFGGLRHPGSSLFNELISFGATLTCLIGYCVGQFRSAEEQVCRGLAYAAASGGLLLVLAIGYGSIMPWREMWDTYTLTFPYLGATILLACLSLDLATEHAGQTQPWAKTVIRVAAGVWGASIGSYLLALSFKATPGAHDALTMVLSGALSAAFWGGVVVIGVVLPLALTFIPRKDSRWPNIIGMIGALIGTALFQAIVSNLGTSTWRFFEVSYF